jgi:type IV secretion system protein TrbL
MNTDRNKIEKVAMRISKYLPLVVLIVAVVFLTVDNSFAEVTTFEEIADKFQSVGAQYLTKLKDYAFGIFKIFILIDVVIFGVRAALNRSDIGETIGQFLLMLLFSAFCAVAIKYYEDWTNFLLEKSKTIAATVGGIDVNFSPMNTGLDILNKVIDAAPSAYTPSGAIQGLGFWILGGVILICFCLMAARMLVVLCEAYIAMSAAILLLGFGGSSMLKDYAINTMRYAVSVAFKLFTMRLVMGIGLIFINNLSQFDKVDLPELFMVLAAAVVLLVLVQTLPETVAGIINGSHTGSGVGMGSVAKGAAAVGLGASAVVGGAAIGGAKVAQTVSRAQKIASMEGHGGVGGTASHLWQSFRAARGQDGHMGGIGSTLRRMRTNTNDMYHAQRAMKDPDYQANPYRANPYMSSAAKPADSTGGSTNDAKQTKQSGESTIQAASQAATQAANDRLNFDFLKPNPTMDEAMKQQKANSQDEM